jgi:activator of HSP90 ATPase
MNDTHKHAPLLHTPSRRQMIAGAAAAFGGLAIGSAHSWAAAGLQADDGISHNAEAIHLEPVFSASPKRVYDALTTAAQFDKVVQLSAAVKSGMALGNKPTQISPEAGSAFFLYGGYISGRQVELVPGKRIVQAWRSGSWDPGNYSIARFDLVEQGSRTKILFDHTGFPVGQAPHLADGWKSNYWEPLEKFLTAAS